MRSWDIEEGEREMEILRGNARREGIRADESKGY